MQERIDTKAKRALYWYDSLAEMARWLEATPRTWRSDRSETADNTHSWDLGAGYKGAWQMARDGWLEGAQRAQAALKAFAPLTNAPETRNDFYGHFPNVPRYCAGAPDSMIRHATPPYHGNGKVLTIIVQVDAPGMVDADHMANFGVGVAQYVNQLEADGTRVEVIGAMISDGNGWHVSHCWRVKLPDQPLDLATMAFAIGHPAMLRRLGFALLERCAAPAMGGYGGVKAPTPADVINVPQGAVVLAGMANADRHARTPAQALEYIGKQIDAALEAL